MKKLIFLMLISMPAFAQAPLDSVLSTDQVNMGRMKWNRNIRILWDSVQAHRTRFTVRPVASGEATISPDVDSIRITNLSVTSTDKITVSWKSDDYIGTLSGYCLTNAFVIKSNADEQFVGTATYYVWR